MRETEFAEVNQNLEKPVIIIKNLQKILFTWRVFVCYTTESCESCASIAYAKIYTFGDSRGWCPAV